MVIEPRIINVVVTWVAAPLLNGCVAPSVCWFGAEGAEEP